MSDAEHGRTSLKRPLGTVIARRLKRRHSRPWSRREVALGRLRDVPSAYALFKKAHRIIPEDLEALKSLDQAATALGDERALSIVLEKRLELEPDALELNRRMAQLAEGFGD